ncbi:MAG: hypothetical protein ACRDOY_10995 [Nocardioidaceae bacterium]
MSSATVCPLTMWALLDWPASSRQRRWAREESGELRTFPGTWREGT